MKKTVALITCLVLVFGLVLTGCSSSEDKLEKIVEEAQSQIGDIKAGLGDMMDIEIMAEGQTLVYAFTFLMDQSELGDIDQLKAGLKAGIEAQDELYEGILEQLKGAGISDAAVLIKYLDKDGAVIYEKEYK